MGKTSNKGKEAAICQQKKSNPSKNKYLKPGDLSRIRYNRTVTRSCTDIGRKRLVALDTKITPQNAKLDSEILHDISPPLLSSKGYGLTSTGSISAIKQKIFLEASTASQFSDCERESRLESLPMELLVKILCHLHHDQLRATFHVSKRIRRAVLIARQCYFNYMTPDRSRQMLLRSKTPLSTEHWPFVSKDGKDILISTPHTPKAPRQAPRAPPHLIKQIAAVLFQESTLPKRHPVSHGMPKPCFTSMGSNRVLFCEDVQAITQTE